MRSGGGVPRQDLRVDMPRQHLRKKDQRLPPHLHQAHPLAAGRRTRIRKALIAKLAGNAMHSEQWAHRIAMVSHQVPSSGT
mmetsp:Transcript_86260/g.126197  ORF Transcript_86260/g.126197 Transcript_86260/m.126197 type:complete len:81 (-) Transcript_86260:15-257(-)